MLAELRRSLICETREVVDQAQREEGSRIAEALQLQTDAARAAERARHDSKPERIARAQRQLKDIAVTMTENGSELGFFFSSLTRHFQIFEIGADIWHILVLPFLSKKAKLLLERMPPDAINTFDKLKASLLKLYNVTSTQRRANFENAFKCKGDSWAQFSHKLGIGPRYICYFKSYRCRANAHLVSFALFTGSSILKGL